VKVLVLDPAMHPVVEGEIGELCISAPSLASEYLFQPELTAQRFIPDPLNPGSTERFYRTGDLVRCLPTGEISFHGRTDRQVKIRGFRVELREIETALEQHPQIQEAVTVARTQKPDPEPRLIAYFATKTKAPITIGHVRAHLQTLLPDYMIPSLFVPLPKLPRMQGGKVDMQSLPAPQATRPLLDAPYQPPRTPTEEAIAAIWENILGMTGIGVADNFLELGGDSLSAARVSVEIIERFDVEVPPDFLFDPGTVAAVAELVAP
jgi:acyl carrier protein